jgi:hypothetical protein
MLGNLAGGFFGETSLPISGFRGRDPFHLTGKDDEAPPRSSSRPSRKAVSSHAQSREGSLDFFVVIKKLEGIRQVIYLGISPALMTVCRLLAGGGEWFTSWALCPS